MIDEKKIEEAIPEVFANYCGVSKFIPVSNNFRGGFIEGIDWFLGNLWHDASEEPKIGKRVIVELKNKEGEEKFYISDRDPNFNWQAEVKLCGFIRWFYVTDLLKGGK